MFDYRPPRAGSPHPAGCIHCTRPETRRVSHAEHARHRLLSQGQPGPAVAKAKTFCRATTPSGPLWSRPGLSSRERYAKQSGEDDMDGLRGDRQVAARSSLPQGGRETMVARSKRMTNAARVQASLDSCGSVSPRVCLHGAAGASLWAGQCIICIRRLASLVRPASRSSARRGLCTICRPRLGVILSVPSPAPGPRRFATSPLQRNKLGTRLPSATRYNEHSCLPRRPGYGNASKPPLFSAPPPRVTLVIDVIRSTLGFF